MGAQNFNFDVKKFSKIEVSQPQFCILDEHFPTTRFFDNFMTAQNLGCELQPLFSITSPLFATSGVLFLLVMYVCLAVCLFVRLLVKCISVFF